MAGVRIVRPDGAIPGVGALLIRNVFRLIDSLPAAYCLGLAVTIFTQRAVRIGDIAAGTVLVYDEEDVALEQFPGDALSRLGIEQVEIVRDLVARWASLSEDKRGDLATRLLASLGEAPEDRSDTGLRAALEDVLSRRGST